MKKTTQRTKKNKKAVLKKETLKPSIIDISTISSTSEMNSANEASANAISANDVSAIVDTINMVADDIRDSRDTRNIKDSSDLLIQLELSPPLQQQEDPEEATLLASFEMSLDALTYSLKADSVNARYSNYITNMLQDNNTTSVKKEQTHQSKLAEPAAFTPFPKHAVTPLKAKEEPQSTFISKSKKSWQNNKSESRFLLQREKEKTSLFDKYNGQEYAQVRCKPTDYMNNQTQPEIPADNTAHLNTMTHAAKQARTNKENNTTNPVNAQFSLASNNASLQRDLSTNSASIQECNFYEHAAQTYRLRYRLRVGLLTSIGVGLLFIIASAIVSWLPDTTQAISHFNNEIVPDGIHQLFIAGMFLSILGSIGFALYFFFYNKALAGQTDATLLYNWIKKNDIAIPANTSTASIASIASAKKNTTEKALAVTDASSLNEPALSIPHFSAVTNQSVVNEQGINFT